MDISKGQSRGSHVGSLLRKDLEKGGRGVLSQMLAGTNYILLLALFSQMGTQKGAGLAQGPDLRLQRSQPQLAIPECQRLTGMFLPRVNVTLFPFLDCIFRLLPLLPPSPPALSHSRGCPFPNLCMARFFLLFSLQLKHYLHLKSPS